METPSLDLYVSEMSPSDRHGGGLTLQRVLGSDLERIRLFAHVSRFASDHPAPCLALDNTLSMPGWCESNRVRKWFGCRPVAWLGRQPVFQRWHGHRCAKRIAHFFTDREPLRALVCPQNVASLYAMEELRRIRRIKYATWVMDDHLVRWSHGAWRYAAGIEPVFASHLRNAASVIVISPAMGELYRERFGVDSEVIFGPADATPAPTASAAQPTLGPGLNLGYFGSLSPWQIDPLGLIADRLHAIHANLEIYSASTELPRELRRPEVCLKGRLPAAKVPETMRSCDAVLLPISFKPELRHMSELNIATKLSECIASGTVTLVLGPPYAAMVRFLKPTGAACVLSGGGPGEWSEVAARLKDKEWRHDVLERAKALVRNELSTETMRGRWREACEALS